jgi:Conjugal transfer protein
MKTLRTVITAGAVLACVALQTACASPPGPTVSYNFGWTTSGADQARPFQVFDDGTKVYVQFDDMRHVPAIFADTPAGRVLLQWQMKFPYAVIDHSERALIFQVGPYEARALRDFPMTSTPSSVRTGPAAPASVSGEARAPAVRTGRAPRASTNDTLLHAVKQ